METYVSFFGAIIPPGEKGTVICELESDQEAELLGSSAGFLSKTLHVTQLALGHDAAEGDHTVYIVSEDRSFALGTLNKKSCPHMKLDIVLVDELVVMKHTGPSDVHVTGYEGFTYGDDEEDEEDDDVYASLISSGEEEGDDDDDDSEDSEESDEDDDEAPELVGLQHNIPSADDEDSIDEAEVSDSELLEMDLNSIDDEDGDDDQMEEDQVDDDSSEGDDSDDSSGDDDSDDSSEEEDSDSESAEMPTSDSDDEDERQAMKKRLKDALSTPQPTKKQKTDTAPATAPGKLSAQAKTPTNEKEYTAALKSYLKEHGPSKLANLGSAVKRPAAVKKLKRYLAENTSVFSYDQSTDVVSLA